MRSVVSVSMPPELAAELKNESEEVGQNFSAYVCELIERGRGSVHAGLFSETEESELPGLSDPVGTPTDRVYAAITAVSRSIPDIAKSAGLSEDETLDIVDKLIEDDEPILIKASDGEWSCRRFE